MNTLELKIPPPLVALVIVGAMWGMSSFGPVMPLAEGLRIALMLLLASAGLAFMMSAVISFRRSQTTVNPMKPEEASALVMSGVFALTRNPMYLGLLLLLLVWATYLWAPWAFLGPVLFFVYITRFQIIPEEKALSALFGVAYGDYCAKVRRWL